MRNSIRTRLTIAFIGLAVGPLLLAGILLSWQSYTVQQRQAILQERQLAQRVSAEVLGFIQQLERELDVLVRVEGLPEMSPEEQQAVLDALLSYEEMFQRLYLVDAQGQELMQATRFAGTPVQPGSWVGSPEFEIPMSNGEIYYGAVWLDQDTNEPQITISVPMVGETQDQRGVLVAQANFEPVWDLIADIELDEGELVFITDERGQVVVHPDRDLALDVASFELAQQDGVGRGLDGRTGVLAQVEMLFGQRTFYVVAERAVWQALSLAVNTVALILGIVVLALLVSGGLIVILTRRIVRPIESLASVARTVMAGDLDVRAQVVSGDDVGGLAHAFNQMTQQLQQTLQDLEQRVQERTQSLTAVAEVSRVLGSVLDLENLLPKVVETVRERFDLYYVGLFLLDQESHFAVLRAGTGDFGQLMIAQGHKLAVGGDSMIGQCILAGQPGIQLDVGKAAIRFNNPLLPYTRSELALPLRSRGKIIGAITIQSTKAAAFDDAYISVLQVMADQVATAIENAQLFTEGQEALRDLEATQRRYLRRMWAQYLESTPVTHYEMERPGTEPLGDRMMAEIQCAVEQERPTVLEVDRENGKAYSALVAPIIYRDEIIGALGIHDKDGTRRWTEEDVSLVESVMERMALAAENLRLLDDAQRRESRERQMREIADKMRRASNIETLIKTTVQEMSVAFNTPHAFLQWNPAMVKDVDEEGGDGGDDVS